MAKPTTSTKSQPAPKTAKTKKPEPISADTAPLPTQTVGSAKPKTTKAQPAKKTQPKPSIAKAATPVKRVQSKKAPRQLATPEAPIVSHDDVALRAYFIAQSRRENGDLGDEHQDWLEAERQIAIETATKSKVPQS